jgi:hypothetical protein
MELDFERAWLAKFSHCLNQVAGEEIRDRVMQGHEELSLQSRREQVIAWSKQAMERLDALVDEGKRRQIMTGCACRYPQADLQDTRSGQQYGATRDIGLAHQMLQKRFESFLRGVLQLSDELTEDVLRRGWGVAGIRQGDTISPTYCYCGAGFYRGIWEEILQRPVEIEVLETVLKGDAVCRFAIRLS